MIAKDDCCQWGRLPGRSRDFLLADWLGWCAGNASIYRIDLLFFVAGPWKGRIALLGPWLKSKSIDRFGS